MVGTGPATAVFVHQAGPRGLCGFWPYADWLARTNGVRSVLFSQCGAGASQCPAGDAANQWLAEGAGHGWELLGGPAGSDWSPLAGTVAAWIKGRHP